MSKSTASPRVAAGTHLNRLVAEIALHFEPRKWAYIRRVPARISVQAAHECAERLRAL